MHSSYRFIIHFWVIAIASSVIVHSFGLCSAVAQDQPTITVHDGEFSLALPPKVVAVLKEFNADFKLWKTSDYAQAVVQDVRESGNPRRAPFALVLDINRDSVLDVVLDGHDKQNSLLICVFSDHHAYKVVTVEKRDLVDPAMVESVDGGKKVHGLNYFLWPTASYGEDSSQPTFTVGYPQQSDSLGNLLNDGGIHYYFFENGIFRCEVQVP